MITRKNTALPILGLAAGLIVAPLIAQPSERPQRGPQGERPAMGQRGPQAERPMPGPRAQPAERPAPGQRGPQAERPAPGQRLQMMQQHLELTPEQNTQIREIMRREVTQLQALRQDTQRDPQQRQAEAQAIRQKVQGEIRAVLTPEQQAKLDAQRAQAPRGPRAPKAEKE
jgi:Spy/CpxP family protein refolding chaperone